MTKLKIIMPGIEVEYEGDENLLRTELLPLLETSNRSHNEDIKTKLQGLNEGLQQDLVTLDSHFASLSRVIEELDFADKQFEERSAVFRDAIKKHDATQAELFAIAEAMQEMQRSFNLQCRQLQEQAQNENRQCTMIANLMKTKHDTAKNWISNIDR
jgi:hypothetical protein